MSDERLPWGIAAVARASAPTGRPRKIAEYKLASIRRSG